MMKNVKNNLKDFKHVDHESRAGSILSDINPLIKLLLTFAVLILIVTRGKYDIRGLILVSVLPICAFIIGDLSIKTAAKRLKVVIPFVLLMGVLEPFFNKVPMEITDGIIVRAGFVSGLVLIIKAFLAVIAGYILIATTPIEEICYALRKIKVPKTLVIVILLVYRYMGILMSEGRRITTSYELRAPGHKGIEYRVWGSFLGQMLIRSIDRAESLYQSMKLRGFDGDFYIEDTYRENN